MKSEQNINDRLKELYIKIADITEVLNKADKQETWINSFVKDEIREKKFKIQGEIDGLNWALKDEEIEAINNNVILYVKKRKKSYRCDCGCNVFSKLSKGKYKCNSCGDLYTAEEK